MANKTWKERWDEDKNFIILILIPMFLLFSVIIIATSNLVYGVNGKTPTAEDIETTRLLFSENDGELKVKDYDVIIDKETGVQYLGITTNHGYSITPLLESDGTPFVTEE